MNAVGFVTDYRIVNTRPVSTGDMDSTDAYAGTFLSAVLETYRATGDLTRLRAIAPALTKAVGAIEATQDADGLTWAKPAWHVKYLMDQAETYAGLRAAASLASTLKDGALARRASADASRLRAGVDALWNASTSSYDWAVHADGARIATNWSVLYSDALQQVWAVAFGLADRTRSVAIMNRFRSSQPAWAQPTATATYTEGRHVVGYWVPAGWAFARIGDTATAAAGAASIRAAADAAGRAWPFTPSDLGQLIMLDHGAPASVDQTSFVKSGRALNSR
jgi:hypothetical protein